MENLRCVCLLTLPLLVVLQAAQAVDIPSYFAVGRSLVLTPPRPGPIRNIVWKHNGDLVVEWDGTNTDYYASFKGRSTLNTVTGQLEIRNMAKADEGQYTVEINNVVQDVRYVAKVPKEVPTPEVVPRPLTCSPAAEKCSFSCEGDTTGAGNVTYSWKMGGGEWEQRGKNISVSKTDVQHVPTISCRMENLVGQKESQALRNPFIPEEQVKTGLIVGLVVGLVVVLLLVIFLYLVGAKRGWWEKKSATCN